jgi:hypothetical protein
MANSGKVLSLEEATASSCDSYPAVWVIEKEAQDTRLDIHSPPNNIPQMVSPMKIFFKAFVVPFIVIR